MWLLGGYQPVNNRSLMHSYPVSFYFKYMSSTTQPNLENKAKKRRKQGNILEAQCNSLPLLPESLSPPNYFSCPKLMDMSVLCSGFPRTLFRPLPLPSPIVPSVSPSTTTASSATRNSQLATTTTLGEEPSNNVNKNNGNGTVTVVRTRRHSRSYLERQSAILEVEQASDVDSAVARYCIFLLCVCACSVKLVTLLLSLGKFLQSYEANIIWVL